MSQSPLSQLLNRHVRLLRLRFRFLALLKSYSLSNFSRMVEHEILIMGIQQLEDIFGVARRNFRAWFAVLGVGANEVSSEGRKSEVTVVVETMH